MKVVPPLLLPLALLTSAALAQPADDAFLAALKTDRQRADTLMALANKQFFRSRFDSALALTNKGLVYAQRTGSDSLQAAYLLTQGNMLTFSQRLPEAVTAIRRAKPHLDRTPAPALQHKYYMLLALAYEGLRRNDSALQYLHSAEDYNNRHDPYRNWMVYNQMGILFQNAEDYPEAEKYFAKAYALTKTKGVRIDHGMVLYRYADLVYNWGRTDKFAHLLEEQQRMVQTSRLDPSLDPVHRVLYVNWNTKSFTERMDFMQNVKADFQKRGMTTNAANANLYLAEFCVQEKAYDRALGYLRENVGLLKDEKDPTAVYNHAKTMYRVLKLAGRHEEALTQADRLFALRDSLYKLQKHDLMLDLQTKYDTEKKEKELQLLNAANDLATLRLAKESDIKQALQRENGLKDSVVAQERAYNLLLGRENSLRSAQLRNEQTLKAAVSRENALRGEQLQKEKRLRSQLIAAAALLLASGALIFYLYRRQRSKNRLIQKQSEELQTLMKEIHHRVKNNLQIISSLLDLQSHSITDREAAVAVKEGKNRVQSMALIHQNLYTEGNVKGIRVQDYVQTLAGSLFDSYNIQKEKIKLVTDIEPLNLDVDTVIPIGLIINELLSNALKYAFAGRDNGEIKLTLKQNVKELQLQVRDNGIGFSPGSMSNKDSFGYKLIKAFSQKLKAKLDVYNDGGACVNMSIQKYKLAG